jgi:hypothetical protein
LGKQSFNDALNVLLVAGHSVLAQPFESTLQIVEEKQCKNKANAPGLNKWSCRI